MDFQSSLRDVYKGENMDMTIHYSVNPWSPHATHVEGLNEAHVCCFLYFG
jgi:hypothetical protein